jgi:alanine or glycine:cation symporter, AGCS family
VLQLQLHLGGPGATFWMIVCGFLGMSTKFVECTLGVKYRDIDQNGVVYGGPMYYLRRGFAGKKYGRIR